MRQRPAERAEDSAILPRMLVAAAQTGSRSIARAPRGAAHGRAASRLAFSACAKKLALKREREREVGTAMDVARLQYLKGWSDCAKDALVYHRPDYNVPSLFNCPSRGGPVPLYMPTLPSEKPFYAPYEQDMLRFCARTGSFGRTYVVQFGDRPPAKMYGFTKTRRIDAPCSILLPLNTPRHWQFPVLSETVAWAAKTPKLVWRGSTTGNGLRRRFVDGMQNCAECDVRFSSVVHRKDHWVKKGRLGGYITPRGLISFKYALSLPGNDVATNLKMLMQQKVVVVMPTPTAEGWLMEGRLRPFVHFVPLDAPGNASALVRWLEENPRLCTEVIRRANRWIRTARVFEPYLSELFRFAADQRWDQTVTSTPQPPSTFNFSR